VWRLCDGVAVLRQAGDSFATVSGLHELLILGNELNFPRQDPVLDWRNCYSLTFRT
jgi:hypothetical protein